MELHKNYVIFFHITLDELLDDNIIINDTNYINIDTQGLEKEDISKIYEYAEMLKLAKKAEKDEKGEY